MARDLGLNLDTTYSCSACEAPTYRSSRVSFFVTKGHCLAFLVLMSGEGAGTEGSLDDD